MIRSSADKETEAVFHNQRTRSFSGPLHHAARKKLLMLNAAMIPEDLRIPPGNHFEALQGRLGVYSIRINVQWRVTFAWDGGPENVRIEDYH